VQRAFDKASNSFFLPPEYASANCVFTFTAVPTISAPTTATAGTTVSITASVAWASAGCGPIKYRFTANGSVIFQGTGGLSKTITTVFSSAGTITITVRVMCSYGDSSVEYASVNVNVTPCVNNSDSVAKAVMLPWPVKAFERAATLACISGSTKSQNYTDSFKEIFFWNYPETNDPCRSVFIYDLQDILHGGIHSHPYFTSNEEYLRGNGCLDATEPLDDTQLASHNNFQTLFSGADKQWSAGKDKPIYMLVPLGGTVKRYYNGITTVLQ
jgi:hypothetical protein